MNTKYFLALCLFGAANGLLAMETITLPEQKIIAQRLRNIGLDHFVEKTKIDKQLGGQERYPLGVGVAVECALYDYNEYLENPQMAFMMQMNKPTIIKAILQDHPQAIESLKKDGVLEQ